MNKASCTYPLVMALFALLMTLPLTSATIFTKAGRLDGKLTRQSEKEIAIQPKAATEIVVDRNEILTVYDDDGNLIWSHPSIVRNDPTPEANTKIEIPSPEAGGSYRGLHVGLGGGFGIIWPSSFFSSFPLGTTPDYRIAFDLTGNGAWYYLNDQALTFGIGYARRNIPISGITESGLIGNGYWPMDYLDLGIGHRWHSDILFFEPGLLTAVNISKAPLNFDTRTRTLTNGSYGTPTYLALYIAIGANIPVTRRLFALLMVRIEHAFTAAVTGNAPTATGAAGETLSTAPINLYPFSATVHAGVSWRFDLAR